MKTSNNCDKDNNEYFCEGEQETNFLLSTSKNAIHLNESIEQLKAGKIRTVEIPVTKNISNG